MGGPWNIFWENYGAMKNLGLWSPGVRNFFEKLVKPSAALKKKFEEKKENSLRAILVQRCCTWSLSPLIALL